MSEKPKKLEPDELYSIVINAIYRIIKQVIVIYDMGFDDVQANIEQLHHGC